MQRRAAGQAAAGHRTAVVDGAEHIGQRRAADAVHSRRPACLGQRTRFGVRIGGQLTDNLSGAKVFQPLFDPGVLGFAGRGHHVKAGTGKQVHADRTDAAGRPGHHDRAGAGFDAPVDERLHAHRRGEACGADGRAVVRTQPLEPHDLISGQPGVFGVAAVVAGADLIAMSDDGVADREVRRLRLDNLAGQVDAGDDGVVAYHPAAGRQRQRVLEVDAGVQHPDRHVAGRQIVLTEGLHRCGYPVAILTRHKRLKGVHSTTLT